MILARAVGLQTTALTVDSPPKKEVAYASHHMKLH
jgi:hypothetical protein